MDSTLARKVTNDAAAFARTVAAQRGRNAVWAERAVREAVAIDETRGACDQHVVDFVAATLSELLAKADGRTWRRGADRTLRSRRGRGGRRASSPAFRQRLLATWPIPTSPTCC